MAGMGPPPKPDSQRRRRNAPTANVVQLPAEGRTGEPPKWPFGFSTDSELAKWRSLWRLPQAVAWERSGIGHVVARYVRTLVEAERPGATAAVMAETRQLEDRLGLSPMSLLRLRWEIVDSSEIDYEDSAISSAVPERIRRKAVDLKMVSGN